MADHSLIITITVKLPPMLISKVHQSKKTSSEVPSCKQIAVDHSSWEGMMSSGSRRGTSRDGADKKNAQSAAMQNETSQNAAFCLVWFSCILLGLIQFAKVGFSETGVTEECDEVERRCRRKLVKGRFQAQYGAVWRSGFEIKRRTSVNYIEFEKGLDASRVSQAAGTRLHIDVNATICTVKRTGMKSASMLSTFGFWRKSWTRVSLRYNWRKCRGFKLQSKCPCCSV